MPEVLCEGLSNIQTSSLKALWKMPHESPHSPFITSRMSQASEEQARAVFLSVRDEFVILDVLQ